MNKVLLVAVIIGTVGVSIIAGIVSYNFIRQLMLEQEAKQEVIDAEQRALMQEEYDERFSGYVNEMTEKCNPDMVSSNSLNASEKLAMKQCADNAWENNGLSDPKFNVFR